MNFKINEKIVLFPAPEGPTNAVIFPLSISKLIFFITSLSSSYEKNTSLNDNFPSILSVSITRSWYFSVTLLLTYAAFSVSNLYCL